MNKDLLALMCCPNDRSSLKLHVLSEEDNEIDTGLLVCLECEDAWTIIHGIPRFVSASSIDLSLDYEFLARYEGDIDREYSSLVENVRRKLSSFAYEAKTRGYDWNEDELNFWEEYYGNRLDEDATNSTSYNRLLPRRRYILDPLQHKNIDTILEVGCGTCGTMYHSDFLDESKLYVGTDTSFNALRVARKFLNVNLVMCDAMNLPFRDESFELILAFGLMHHLEQKDQSLEYFFTKVEPAGYIGFAEKLRSKFDFDGSRIAGSLKNKLSKNQRDHGEDEYIDGQAAISIACEHGSIISERYEYSLVRVLLVKLLVDKLAINNKVLTRLIMALDYFVIDYLGWLTPLLQGHGLILLAQRRS